MLFAKCIVSLMFGCVLFAISLSAQDESKQEQPQSNPASVTIENSNTQEQIDDKPAASATRVLSEQELIELRKLIDLNQDLNSRVNFLSKQMNAFQAKVPGVKQEFWQECSKFLDRDELASELAEVYAKHFTQQDIKELSAFFESRVGRKYVNVSSKLVGDANEKTNSFGRKIGRKMAEKLDAEGYAR